jgi:endonuclease/exonuclease/phosphatase (EEP) superfamily protein YafD
VLLNERVVVDDLRVGKDVGSDHRPVVTDLRITR